MLDKQSKFLKTYLSKSERDTFFDCYTLPPTLRQARAKDLTKDILWIASDLARNGDVELKEHYINYVSALSSFLRGEHPSLVWASLRKK